jgi:hypothetical protein
VSNPFDRFRLDERLVLAVSLTLAFLEIPNDLREVLERRLLLIEIAP